MVPMVEPPLRYATFTKNDSACFNELVDPVPTSVRNDKTGLSELCNEVGAYFILSMIFKISWPPDPCRPGSV